MRDTFKSDLRIATLMEAPTIAKFAQKLEDAYRSKITTGASDTQILEQIKQDAQLSINEMLTDVASFTFNNQPSAILLTGSTGFLGAFILHELLLKTQATIYCLVRASNEQQAVTRIENNLKQYQVWDPNVSYRVIAIVGDLSLPRLGLSGEHFKNLAEKIDVIYHSAAFVNFLYPYSMLRATNVLGTKEIIRLACEFKIKPLHYISTLAVFVSYGFYGKKIITEEDEVAYPEHLYMGYVESKWVAEKLLKAAAKNGLPVSIYRPHDIGGHSYTGITNTRNELLTALIKSYIQLGYVPDLNVLLEMPPVDIVAQSIIAISQKETAIGKAFNLNLGYILLKDFVKYMRSYGYSINELAYQQWVTKLTIDGNHVLDPFIFLFTEKWSEKKLSIAEMYTCEMMPKFEHQNTLAALKGTSLEQFIVDGKFKNMVDKNFLKKYLNYLISVNFLPNPNQTIKDPNAKHEIVLKEDEAIQEIKQSKNQNEIVNYWAQQIFMPPPKMLTLQSLTQPSDILIKSNESLTKKQFDQKNC